MLSLKQDRGADDREVVDDRGDRRTRRSVRSALSALVTIAPRASRIGDASMIRVSSTVRSSIGSVKPGVIRRTNSGAQMNATTASTSSPPEHQVR